MSKIQSPASYQIELINSLPIEHTNKYKPTKEIKEPPKGGRINHMPKFKPFHKYQKPMIGLSAESFLDHIETVIPRDHLVRLIREVVDSLSTEEIESKYSFNGQKTYHPKLLLRILFYGYATGVRSSRKLAEKCISDHLYLYLMECYKPDHRTISDFRKNNLEMLEKYFIEIVHIFKELKFIQIGKIYIDGTKIRANASVSRTKDESGFSNWLSSIKQEISTIMQEAVEIDNTENKEYKTEEKQAELLKKLSDKKYLHNQIETALSNIKQQESKKMNLTDSDANNMKSGGSRDIRPSYNCQTSVSEEGVILAAEAQTNAKDSSYLKPLIEQSESNLKSPSKEVIADCGYESYSNYEYLDQKGIDGYIPDSDFKRYKAGVLEREQYRYHHINFQYDQTTNSYLCPEGKRLKFSRMRINSPKSRNRNKLVYKGIECENCVKRKLCTKQKARSLAVDMREPLLKKMRSKLLSDKGQQKYSKRGFTIEPIFGHLKYNLGYRNFLLRGLKKVRAEFKLMCIGWNLKKLLKMRLAASMA